MIAKKPEYIKAGQPIKASFLNGILDMSAKQPLMKGRGYADSTMQAFATGGSPGTPSTILIGKPSEDIERGILEGSARVINLWNGPADPLDEATGDTIEVDYATGDFTTEDYVVITPIGDYLYVSCFPDASTVEV